MDYLNVWTRLQNAERVIMSGDDYDGLCTWLMTAPNDDGANALASIPATEAEAADIDGDAFHCWILTDEQSARRVECEDAVRGPGKFEGEAPHAFHFYDALNGDGEELGTFDGCAVVAFDVELADVELFPDLAGESRVYFYESEQGFWNECDEPGEADDEGEVM